MLLQMFLVVLAGTVALQEAAPPAPTPEPAPAPAAPAKPVATPARFERLVSSYGGRIDFLFTDSKAFRDYMRGSSGSTLSRLRFGSRLELECRASSLCETKGGNLLCAYFAGSDPEFQGTGIWISRFDSWDGWSAPEQVARVAGQQHWSPVLFRDPFRAIYLFFKVGPDSAVWQTYWCKSEDGGRTWDKPVELVPGDKGGRGPVKNKPIILEDGAWLAPASLERGDREQGAWKAFVDRSDDVGQSWQRSDEFPVDPAVVPGAGIIQPALWTTAPDQVHALVRTSGGFIGRTDSADGGKTWSPVTPSGLANNNSPFDAVRVDDGRVFVVYNPSRPDGGPRTPLNLAVSSDNGATWRDLASLENQNGDFVSPTIIPTRNGIAISYTWKGERIRCWQIPLKSLEDL